MKVLIIKGVELEKTLFEFNLNYGLIVPRELWISNITNPLPV